MDGTSDEQRARAVLQRAVDELDRGLGILAEAEDRWYRASTDEQRWESAGQAQEAAEVLLDVRADLDAAFDANPGIRPAMAALWHRAGLWLASTFLLTKAYSLSDASRLAPFEYTALLWSIFLGWLVWGHFPDALTWLGIAVICASGVGIGCLEWRRGRALASAG